MPSTRPSYFSMPTSCPRPGGCPPWLRPARRQRRRRHRLSLAGHSSTDALAAPTSPRVSIAPSPCCPGCAASRPTWGGSLGPVARALARALAPEPHPRRPPFPTTAPSASVPRLWGLRVLTRRALLVPTPAGGRRGLGLALRPAAVPDHPHLSPDPLVARLRRPEHCGCGPGVCCLRTWTGGGAACTWRADRACRGRVCSSSHWLHAASAWPDGPGTGRGQGLLAVLKPVVDLFHWSLVVAALAAGPSAGAMSPTGSPGPGHVTVRNRAPWAWSPPSPAVLPACLAAPDGGRRTPGGKSLSLPGGQAPGTAVAGVSTCRKRSSPWPTTSNMVGDRTFGPGGHLP